MTENRVKDLTYYEELKDNMIYFDRINNELQYCYKCLFSIIIRVQHNFDNRVLKKDKYSVLLEKTDILLEDYRKFNYPYSVEKFKGENKYEVMGQILEFQDKIRELAKECGMKTCSDLLRLFFGSDLKFISAYEKLVNFYDNLFIPTSCKTESNMIDVDTDLQLLPFAKKPLSSTTKMSSTLIEKIDGARIYFPHKNKMLVVTGYFSKDPLNITFIGGTLGAKMENIKNRAKFLQLKDDFKYGYLNQIPIRDFLVNEETEIIDMIESAYKDLVKYRSKSLPLLVKEFVGGTTEKQRYILTLFLLSDVDDQFTAHIIYDMICNTSNLLKPQPMAEEIYKCLHYSIQKLFRIAFKNVEKKIQDLQALTDDDIPYEKRIASLKAPDNVKAKALEKLKEVKGTRESSAKAQQYLDGLLKIPFGVYKKESILTFLGDFCENMTKFVAETRTKLEELSKGRNDLDNLVEFFMASEWDAIETETQVNKFLIGLENVYELINRQLDNDRDSPKEKIAVEKEHNDVVISNLKLVKRLAEKIDDDDDDENKKNISKEVDKMQIERSHSTDDVLQNIEATLLKCMKEFLKFHEGKKHYLTSVRKTLDDCVYGHKESKIQLERLIAQWMTGKMEGTVFGFQGPPGVGKTTLAKKGLAKCLLDDEGNPRPFGFLPLGGSSNGATLEGHSYTYLGSTWGRIADILMETKCMNPIIYIDEVDKISNTEHGKELIGILTHLTDASQNNEFSDKYFAGIKLDLSKALFVFSYNDPYALDRILRDRITEIRIEPLTILDKLHIVQDYSMPDILKQVGYKGNDIFMGEAVTRYIINTYTMEAGVRKLNEKLYEIVREINLKRITDEGVMLPFEITEEYVKELFSNKPRIRVKKIAKEPMVGYVNGLYATATGVGGITLIECVKTPSDRKLSVELTGSLGDVMKESISVAKTLAWSLLPKEVKKEINEEMESLGNFGLHVHCPEGGTNKDGPSAGLAITLSIVSRLSGVAVKNDVCITGETCLTGKAMAIGGLDSKLEGGFKAGCKLALVPVENKDDVDKILKKRKEDGMEHEPWIEIRMVENINEVLAIMMVENDVKFNVL